MDDSVTRLALRSQEPKIILHGSDDGGMCGEEYVVELQETVLLSDGENDGENEGVAVRSFSSDELVIQDAVEDVVAEDDEGVAVETCVMSLEGEEDEEDGVTVAEEELVEERENELHSSGDYLMISLDEDGKMVSADGEEVTVEGALDDQEVEKDEDGQEVIKVYIFKADSGDDELGEGDSDSVCKPLREKMLYMSVSDGHHTHTDGGSKLSDEVYMEVVVGGEEPVCNDRPYESKDFMPVNWTAAYDDSECCENRNGAASAVLHIDESEMPHTLKQQQQHSKTHRRAEHRQVQTAIIIGPYGQPLTVYPCVLCGKKFKSRGFLKRHTRNHHQDVLSRKKYQCTDCDFTTNKKSSFHSHMEEHTQHTHTLSTKSQFESETLKDFHQQAPLFSNRLHPQPKTKMVAVPAKKTHKCKFCEYETAEQGLLNRHLLAVHSKNFPHVCVECGKGFRHPSELRKHTRTHTGEKPYSCTHCSYKSADSSNLKTHMKTKHSREDEDEETAEVSVPHTEQLTEDVPETTQDHDPDHDHDEDDNDEARGHRCDLCDHRSSNSSDLKRHVISVHTKDYPHKCDACGKGFHRPSELKKHAASHKAKRPHQCRHCSFKTADPFVLSRHILSVHTKEQQQQETQQNANEQQQQQQQPAPSLQTQERSPPKKTIGAAQLALGGAPIIKKVIGAKGPRERRVYQCQYCDYSTGDASGFKRHVISIHTKDYPHRCQFCSKGFRRPSEKNQHIMRHHKDMMPSE